MNKQIKRFIISIICSVIIFNLLCVNTAMAKGNFCVKNFGCMWSVVLFITGLFPKVSSSLKK